MEAGDDRRAKNSRTPSRSRKDRRGRRPCGHLQRLERQYRYRRRGAFPRARRSAFLLRPRRSLVVRASGTLGAGGRRSVSILAGGRGRRGDEPRGRSRRLRAEADRSESPDPNGSRDPRQDSSRRTDFDPLRARSREPRRRDARTRRGDDVLRGPFDARPNGGSSGRARLGDD